MKITNNIYLEKSGQYFRLVEKNDKNRDINIREFGTVYQALQAIIEYDYDLDKPLEGQLKTLVQAIEMNKDKIRDQFRIEVKTS